MVLVAEPARPPLRLATWHAGDGDRVRITPLYRGPLVSMGTFWCAPDDVRWSLENFVGEVAHIVFPTMPVWIGTGHELGLAGPNHAVFFNPGDVFRRRRFNGHGDRNDFIVVGQDTLDEWLHEARFPGPLGKLPPRPYLTVRAIARALASGGDGLLAEEALLRLGHGTVTGAFRPEQWAPHRRRRPPSVVEDAKALLCARFTEHLTLEELGRAVNVSPFHLARSFRRHTGFTLHEYRVNLRLKAALERLAAGDEDVAVIARAVGFSSHSHLTATFHRAFGIPPSCVRKRSLPPYA